MAQLVKVTSRFSKFLHHVFVNLELLDKFGIGEIGAVLDIYRLVPFISSLALGFLTLAVEFFSTVRVAEDGLRLTAKVQKQWITLTKEDFSAALGVVDNNIEE